MLRATASILLRALLAAALAAPAAAHDFWIEPESFRPTPEQILRVRLRVGVDFQGDEVARSSEHIRSFAAHGPAKVLEIAGRDAQRPAGLVRPIEPGLYVLGYDSHSKLLELDPEKFALYLREEGLESILRERERLGESQKPARELYARCAKALVRVGDGSTAGFDRPLGYALELVPVTDPFAPAAPGASGANGAHEFRLLYQQKPLGGALVVALPRDEPAKTAAARTDADGRVSLRLHRGGAWLVKAVHMTRSSERERAEWQSHWASLAFESPLPSPVAPPSSTGE